MIRNEILILLLLLLALVSTGCENVDLSKLSDEDLSRISEKLIVCEPPYMRHGSDCCIDQNTNMICDEDEEKTTPSGITPPAVDTPAQPTHPETPNEKEKSHKDDEQSEECTDIEVPYEVEEEYTEQVLIKEESLVLKTIDGENVKDIAIIGTTRGHINTPEDVCEPTIRLFNPNNVETLFKINFETYTAKPYIGAPTPFTHYERQTSETVTLGANEYTELVGDCYRTTVSPAPAEAEITADSIVIDIIPNEFINYVSEPAQYENVTKNRTVTEYRTETVCE